ncbi:hypothetical protein Acr_00g0070030 [Actinidia rufa]|uniref:Uncharacterized protein n=1 Tax=Actinidia rufa TaxID=165716 RepID=A0A7J0DT97_9ERIC|nr:hypothetical protein Acr_00g0070030 [Actinidia rufa]
MSPHASVNRARTLQPTRLEFASLSHALTNPWRIVAPSPKFCPNRLPTRSIWTQISQQTRSQIRVRFSYLNRLIRSNLFAVRSPDSRVDFRIFSFFDKTRL